jgi:hypothetical protein
MSTAMQSPSRRSTQATARNGVVLPGDLLEYHQDVQQLANLLPNGSIVIVLNPAQRHLARSLSTRGPTPPRFDHRTSVGSAIVDTSA